jgi:SAM-dependent methyltransferase
MTNPGINVAYTQHDHALRENDRYARAKYHLTLRWLRPHIRAGALLYNIGVGSGYFNHLAVRAGLNVVGCEPDPAAYVAAAASRPHAGCDLVEAGLAVFARGRTPADFIVMHDVLEHIEDDAAAARDLRSLAKRGTRIVLSVPASPRLFGQHDVELGHFRRYTKKTLRAVLGSAFRFRRLRYFGMASIPIVMYFSVIKRASYPRAGAADNLLSKTYGAVCTLESYVPEPLGTALIAELEPLG